MVNASHFATFMSLNNQSYMTRPTVINQNLYEYNLGLRYYPFMVNLNIYNGSCNTLNDPSDRICVPNKIKGIELSVLNTIQELIDEKH